MLFIYSPEREQDSKSKREKESTSRGEQAEGEANFLLSGDPDVELQDPKTPGPQDHDLNRRQPLN